MSVGYPMGDNALQRVRYRLYGVLWGRLQTAPPRRPDVTVSQRQKHNRVAVLVLHCPKEANPLGVACPKIRNGCSLSKGVLLN